MHPWTGFCRCRLLPLTLLSPELESCGSREKVRVVEGKWRPLVVEAGALGSFTGVSKIAASVIAPLADHNVSVYCASTNQEDYVLVSVLWEDCCDVGGCVMVGVLDWASPGRHDFYESGQECRTSL